MSRVLCSLAAGSHVELLDLALPSYERFADRHGYEVAVRDASTGDLHPAWEKIRVIRELLADHEEVLWIDSDAMIVDFTRDIFDDLERARGWGWVMHIYLNALLPNTGVLALRSVPETLAILDHTWALKDRFENHPWWENAAIMHVLGFAENRAADSVMLKAPTEHITTVQFLGTEWNSIGIDHAPRPRIKHYAGMSHDLRLEAMRWDRANLEKSGRAPSYDLAVILLLHDASEYSTLRCLESIAELGDDISNQTVIVAPPTSPLDPLLAQLEGDVAFIRSSGPPDHALAGGLAAADATVVVVAVGGVVLEREAVGRMVTAMKDPATPAAIQHGDGFDLMAFPAAALPVSTWVGGHPNDAAHPLAPVVRALTGADVPIVEGVPKEVYGTAR